jgi:NAD(P)-dependent dehydrogenase (short-subunit alcohol dehydrogenase family)
MAAKQQHRLNSGFGAKTEPSDILASSNLQGKVALVTGGYSGIGLETTRALLNAGARVHVPVRSAEKAAANLAGLPGEVIVGQMDLAEQSSIRNYTGGVLRSEEKLDLLINNAGVMACPETRVGPGWEYQFATNHLGHFALTTQLLPLLQNAGQSRVVCLSSVGHRRSGIRWGDIHFTQETYDKWVAYGQAKTANALFALGLDLKFRQDNIRGFSVHPGGIMTPLQRHLDNEEMAALGWLDEEGNLSELARQMFKSPTQGCSTTLWAATSPALDGLGGLYCEDCDVADLASAETPRYKGVESWAADDEEALRLWEVTEQMLATD